MGFDRPVLEAFAAANDLGNRLTADLDQVHGAFTWWHDYKLDSATTTGIMDYLCGLVMAVQQNLRSAAVHLDDLKAERYTDDLWIRGRIRNAGGDIRRDGIDSRRDARLDAHAAGFLRAVGSVLDTLAGVVIGVGGFNADLIKADLGYLHPLTQGAGYPGPDVRRRLKLTEAVLDAENPQGGLLRAICAAIVDAGPSGWLDWTLWSRNDQVHRAARGKPVLRIDERTLARPLPRQPKYSEAHAMRTAKQVECMFFTEDSLDTFAGVLGSVNTTAVGVLRACSELWDYRRGHPEAIEQPATQWRTGGSLPEADFDGYKPGSAVLPDDSIIRAHPQMGRRWQAARVLDGQDVAGD